MIINYSCCCRWPGIRSCRKELFSCGSQLCHVFIAMHSSELCSMWISSRELDSCESTVSTKYANTWSAAVKKVASCHSALQTHQQLQWLTQLLIMWSISGCKELLCASRTSNPIDSITVCISLQYDNANNSINAEMQIFDLLSHSGNWTSCR